MNNEKREIASIYRDLALVGGRYDFTPRVLESGGAGAMALRRRV